MGQNLITRLVAKEMVLGENHLKGIYFNSDNILLILQLNFWHGRLFEKSKKKNFQTSQSADVRPKN